MHRTLSLLAMMPLSFAGCAHSSAARPAVILVPEFERAAREFSHPAPELADADFRGFEAAWASARKLIEQAVTPDSIAGITRYRGQGSTPVLNPDWVSRMPMRALGATEDQRVVLFGQTPEESPIALPTERPLVYRRLVLLASYDLRSRSIDTVYATIQGWVEE